MSGAELLPLKPNQCIILSTHGVLPLSQGECWLDNVYFRYAQESSVDPTSANRAPPAPLHLHGGNSFVTNVTIQGDGVHYVGAFWVFPTANLLMMGA
jgi:hypothetical protein